MKDFSLFYPDGHEKHFSPDHPERPDRIEAIQSILRDAGLWQEGSLVAPVSISDEILGAIHTSEHIRRVEASAKRVGMIDADTYTTQDSWQLALNAAGGAIAIAQDVYDRKSKRGLALSRPPGHHATRDQAMGFCLLNNVALSAEMILQTTEADRVAILDIDLHHGNGTQDIFYQRGDVFFCSIHQYPLYPMTGLVNETGNGEGARTNLNIPFPPYAGDEARRAALEQVILPLLDRFEPDMVLVSAGFDAHWRDPLGHQLVTADGYGWMISKLAKFADINCNGRIAVILEGGYDLEGSAASCLALSQALIGQEWEDLIGPSPLPEDDYWKDRLGKVLDEWLPELSRQGE